MLSFVYPVSIQKIKMTKPTVPKAGFSNNFIKSLPVLPDRYIVYDGNGLGVRVSQKGRKTFIYSYRFGKPKTWTIGAYPAISLSEANEMRFKAKEMLSRGLDPAVHSKSVKAVNLEKAKQKILTFGDLADRFLADHTASETTIGNYRECLYRYIFQSKRPPRKDGRQYDGHVYTDWSNVPAEDITRDDIRSILKSITDQGITRRANLTNTALKLLWSYGVNEELVRYDPTSGIKDPAKKTRGTRVLSIEEIPVFWHGVLKIRSHRTVTILRLLLLLARRETEVCGAKWSEFDLDAGTWFIPVRRNVHGVMISSGLKVHESSEHLVDGLMVALPKMAVELLREWRKRAGNWEHVFPGEKVPTVAIGYNVPSKATRRSWKVIGMKEPFTPHDLRRTAMTNLARLKVAPHIRARITAHSVGNSVEKTYDKYEYLDEKREAMELWAAEIQRLISMQ